jgi:hypothetical protein
MGINSFLERLGFVRLRDFGLLLTPDRRIVTTREVLDDGYGATIVGYEDRDLAATELVRKRRATTGGASNVAFRPLPPPPPPPTTDLGVIKKTTAPMPAPQLVKKVTAPMPAPPPFAPKAIPAPKPNVVANPVPPNPFLSNTVAYPATVESKFESSQFAATEIVPSSFATSSDDDFVKEDEWEWQIAKARAQSDDDTPVKTAPVNPFAKEARRATIHPAQLFATAAATHTPRTIIPVPSLPAAIDPRLILDAYHAPSPPRRMARGTHPRPAANDDTSTAVNLRAVRR